jgi:hypothetical protein
MKATHRTLIAILTLTAVILIIVAISVSPGFLAWVRSRSGVAAKP